MCSDEDLVKRGPHNSLYAKTALQDLEDLGLLQQTAMPNRPWNDLWTGLWLTPQPGSVSTQLYVQQRLHYDT